MHARFILVLAVAYVSAETDLELELKARAFLERFDENATDLMYQYSLASWEYNTNITSENSDNLAQQGAIWAAYYSGVTNESLHYPVDKIKDPLIKMQLIALQDEGSGALSKDKVDHLNKVMSEMSTIYSTATVCKADDPFDCHTLEPGDRLLRGFDCLYGLESIMADSRDYYERLHVWEGWRVEVGKKMRPLYEDYADLKNEAAKLNGYADYGDYWRGNYETMDEGQYKYTRDELMADVKKIYTEIMPLYTELHAYVRAKLQKVYPGHIDSNGFLPAHLLGDMWGRFWTNLYQLTVPYPNKTDIDVTAAMVEQGWEPLRMFEEAEKFFMAVGLYKMFPNFWNNSMFVKPTDGRKVVCHPTAWDMGNREDFRIKMCSVVNMDHFLTAHHEMGHNQYQMAYRNLSYLLRDGANEGFHEAVGEIMSLSAATPKHLKALGLLASDFQDDNETEINFLMKQALTIVATLPFTYMLEDWRWQVFQGKIPKDQWMRQWWQMKRDLVGVVEPLPRDETYCDPPAIYHVSSDYSFIRYFTRTIYQFQFHASLCEAAGHVGPLFKCDISKPTRNLAGQKLRTMLELGKSVSWTRALEQISNATRMDSRPLLDYFSSLLVWLKKENANNNNKPGWERAVVPYSVDAFKVRLSLKTALGDEAYPWSDNELYLFKTVMAYTIRQYYLQEKGMQVDFVSENIYTYNLTPRVSFFFVVTDPASPTKTIPKDVVEAAIRLSRGRINSAFMLDDDTLEFVGLMTILTPPAEPPFTVWLLVFGVVLGLVVCLGSYLIISGYRERNRKSKEAEAENPYGTPMEGETNKSFEPDYDEPTQL